MKLVLTILSLFFSLSLYSQTIIFSENCTTPGATTLVNTYTGFQNYGKLTFTGNADVRTTVPSSGYTGASGGGNIFITSTLNTNCTITGINTIGYNTICLQFGILKTTNGSNGSQLAVEYSIDGITWTALSFTLGTGSGSSNVWTYIQPSCSACGTAGLPSTSNLRLRFRMATVATGLQFRIDDIKLTGAPNIVLPIELTSFTVRKVNESNLVEWTSFSEDSVILETSFNLYNWKEIARLNSIGQFLDKENKDNISYYRLYIPEEHWYSNVIGILNTDEPARYYDINGVEEIEPKPGKLYIMIKNGKTYKIIYK